MTPKQFKARQEYLAQWARTFEKLLFAAHPGTAGKILWGEALYFRQCGKTPEQAVEMYCGTGIQAGPARRPHPGVSA